jgi:hypothetical protein
MTFIFLIVIIDSTDSRCPERTRSDRDRPLSHAHPPGQHPRYEHLSEPRPERRPCHFRGYVGPGAVVAVHRCTDWRSDPRGPRLSAVRRESCKERPEGLNPSRPVDQRARCFAPCQKGQTGYGLNEGRPR